MRLLRSDRRGDPAVPGRALRCFRALAEHPPGLLTRDVRERSGVPQWRAHGGAHAVGSRTNACAHWGRRFAGGGTGACAGAPTCSVCTDLVAGGGHSAHNRLPETEMSKDAELHCRCGEIHGRVTNASPETVNRVVCYCDDCQAFLHHLGRTDLLDAHGGTDIVQVAPASLSFDRGNQRIAGLRLTPKGLYRWYASCCKTPLGNTLGPAIPFIGIIAKAFDVAGQMPDDLFGKPIASIQRKYAIGSAPKDSTRLQLRVLLRAFRMVLAWRLG